MNNKYYVKIEKAYEENGDWFVQGIASGTLEDRDEQRMSKAVVESFAKAIPLPLTNSHPGGDIAGEMGEVVYAEVMDTPTNDLFIKGKLDREHPNVPYFVKQVQKGKQFAFSIEGIHAKKQTVWSDNLQKFVDEYTEVTPTGISITTMPSYSPSFLEVVAKSANDKTNLDINTNKMEDNTTETVETVTETETILETEVKPVEAQPEVEAEPVETEPVAEEVTEVEQVTKSEEIMSILAKITERMEAMEKSMTERLDGITKSVEDVEGLKKSVETTQLLVKSMPQIKKSYVAKQQEAVKAEPKNFAEALLMNAPVIG
jgi:hypothetical protein